MANTGWKNPTTNFATGNNIVNPTNVYTENGVYGTHTSSEENLYCFHGFGGFGFNIPSGSTIDGIEVKIKGYCATTENAFRTEVSTNSQLSNQKSIDMPSSNDWVTLGGSSDLWGKTWWTAERFNDANLIVYLTMFVETIGGTGYADNLQVKIYYTENNNSILLGTNF